DIATATVVTKAASQPESLLWTPSSRSIISSARSSASALISAAGLCSSVTSSLIHSPQMKSPASRLDGARCDGGLFADLDALLGEVLDGARRPGDRGGLGLLVLELEARRLLVRPGQALP